MARITVASLQADISRLELLIASKNLALATQAETIMVLRDEVKSIQRELVCRKVDLVTSADAPTSSYKARRDAAKAQAIATGKAVLV